MIGPSTVATAIAVHVGIGDALSAVDAKADTGDINHPGDLFLILPSLPANC